MDSLYAGPVQALSSPKPAKACLLMYCVSLLQVRIVILLFPQWSRMKYSWT